MSDKGQLLFDRVGQWSNRTFGDEAKRGPIGPLKHLVKEVLVELLGYHEEQVTDLLESPALRDCDPTDLYELADVQILVDDAVRRAGHTWCELLSAADAKQARNEKRSYPMPVGDEISEHDRSKD